MSTNEFNEMCEIVELIRHLNDSYGTNVIKMFGPKTIKQKYFQIYSINKTLSLETGKIPLERNSKQNVLSNVTADY